MSIVESARAAADCGVESTIFATDMAEPASAASHRRADAADLPPGADELDVRLFPARTPYRLAYSRELSRALRRDVASFDVVHIHSLFLFPQFAACRAAVAAARPYVVSPRGALDPWLRRRGRIRKAVNDVLWQRRMLARAAALHVTSAEEARLIDDVAPHVPRCVVPNGIRWDDFQSLPDPSDFRDRFLGGHRGAVVLNLGRIARKKGLDVLIAAFADAAVPDSLLALVGPDDEGLTPDLAAAAAAAGIADRVRFVGMLQGRDKLAALAAADVWALPSHTENFGVAVVEALAAGVATVVSPAVNIAPELAAAGAAVVAENVPAAFGAALRDLLVDDARRVQLARRGREFARRFDWAEVAPLLAQMYAAAAGVPRPRAATAVAS